jgi:hypothetical protein
MRRIRTGLGLAALAGIGATVGLAAPAHASTASSGGGYVYYNNYGWPDQCSYYGNAGEQAGQWISWYCYTALPATVISPGNYWLYVQY